MEGTKNVKEVLKWSVFIILTQGHIVTVIKGITIINCWVKESAIFTWNILWWKSDRRDSPSFEQVSVLSQDTVHVEFWLIVRKSLEVWEGFIHDLRIKGCWRLVNLTVAIGTITWLCTCILISLSSVWYPDTEVTWDLDIFYTENIVGIEGQVPIPVSAFKKVFRHIRIVEVGCYTIFCCQKQWAIKLITVCSTHVHRYSFIATQAEIIVVGHDDTHTLRTSFWSSQISSVIGTFTITNRCQEAIISDFLHFHVLTTSYILDTSTQEGVDGIKVRRLFSHVVTILTIEVSVINTCYRVLVGQHESINRWQVVWRISLVSLINILIVNLEGFLDFITSEIVAKQIWIDTITDDTLDNRLSFRIVGTGENIVSHTFTIFIVSTTWIQTTVDESSHVPKLHTCIFITHQEVGKGITKGIINRKLCPLSVLVIVWVVGRPSFQVWQVLNGIGFRLVNTIGCFEVVWCDLEKVSIHIVQGIDTQTVKVSCWVIGHDASNIHHKVEPVKLLCLNSWVWVINIVGKQELKTTDRIVLEVLTRTRLVSRCAVKQTIVRVGVTRTVASITLTVVKEQLSTLQVVVWTIFSATIPTWLSLDELVDTCTQPVCVSFTSDTFFNLSLNHLGSLV